MSALVSFGYDSKRSLIDAMWLVRIRYIEKIDITPNESAIFRHSTLCEQNQNSRPKRIACNGQVLSAFHKYIPLTPFSMVTSCIVVNLTNEFRLCYNPSIADVCLNYVQFTFNRSLKVIFINLMAYRIWIALPAKTIKLTPLLKPVLVLAVQLALYLLILATRRKLVVVSPLQAIQLLLTLQLAKPSPMCLAPLLWLTLTTWRRLQPTLVLAESAWVRNLPKVILSSPTYALGQNIVAACFGQWFIHILHCRPIIHTMLLLCHIGCTIHIFVSDWKHHIIGNFDVRLIIGSLCDCKVS